MEENKKAESVSDLMRIPVLISNEVHLKDVLQTLIDEKSNIACVVDADGKLLGSVTTVDVIRAVLPDYMESDSVAARFADDQLLKEDLLKSACHPVSELVNTEEVTVSPDTKLIEAAVLSSKDSNGRLVVVNDNNEPVGILSRTHIKIALADFLGVRGTAETC